MCISMTSISQDGPVIIGHNLPKISDTISPEMMNYDSALHNLYYDIIMFYYMQSYMYVDYPLMLIHCNE